MNIKEVERRSGLPRSGIRYYESEGLLSPVRLENGYRDYSQADLDTLLKIKRLRELGLTLAEIRAVQSGQMQLSDALRSALGRLGEQRGDLAGAEAECRALIAAGAGWDGLLDEPEHEPLYVPPQARNIKYPGASAARTGMGAWFAGRSEPGPWRRFFARWLDQLLYNTVACIVIVLVFRVNPMLDRALDSLLTWAAGALLMLICEPLCLHYFGATPGKALLGITVRDGEGRLLSLRDASERTRGVLLGGLGLKIPVVQLITLILAYRRCIKDIDQPWDRDYGRWMPVCTARSHVVSAPAVAGYVAAALLVITVTVMAGDMPPNRGVRSAAEFAENYNAVADYLNMNGYERMTDRGLVEDVPANAVVMDVYDGGTKPEFTLTEEGGVLTRVEFTAERNPDGGTVDNYRDYMELAVMAYVWGRPGTGSLNFLARQNMLAELDAHSFEPFECEWSGVRVTCEVEHSGYLATPFGLYAREGEEQDFSLHFVMETVPQ